MRMKRIIGVLAGILAAASLVSAQGMMGGQGWGGVAGDQVNQVNVEKSSISGTVDMTSGQPQVQAKDGLWYIAAPLRSIVFLPWKQGASISIEGYLVPQRTLSNGVTIARRIIATKITIDGKSFEIAQSPGRGAMDCLDCPDQDGRQPMMGRGRRN